MIIVDGPVKCADCQEIDGEHEIRKRRLCTPCFIRYVNSKILKRMESYRIKNQSGHEKKRLFLPLSGGVSSHVLLGVLDAQLEKQVSKQGRTAYDLVVGHADMNPGQSAVGLTWYTELSEKYPMHTFLPVRAISESLSTNTTLQDDLASLSVTRVPDMTNEDFYTTILASATTATTLSDLQEIIRTRLLVALARQHNCSSILYGHSDSRLAALSLAAVAKGRGGAVPASIADGPNEGFCINQNFPVRDLFKTELELYAQVVQPSFIMADSESYGGVAEPQKLPSLRNTSIDDLLTGYITSQGEKYPSIMANVVRTAGKLLVSEPGTAPEKRRACVFCRGTILSTNSESTGTGLCYGCTRMKQDIRVPSI